jgi:hypothetical protein
VLLNVLARLKTRFSSLESSFSSSEKRFLFLDGVARAEGDVSVDKCVLTRFE